MNALDSILPAIPAFLLVFFRLTGLFLFAPVFGSNVIPRRVKTLLALTLTFCIFPIVAPASPVQLTLPTFAFTVGTEMLIGIIIGYGASIPLVAMQVGGQLIGQQLGLGLAQVFNPDFNEESEVISQLLFMVALVLFLLINGHHLLLAALIHSFHNVPLGGIIEPGNVLNFILGLLQAMFELGLRVGAPLLCMIFLETIAMGFVARTVPQLNILTLGFPLRIMIGFLLIIGVCSLLFTSINDAFRNMFMQLMQLFTT